MSAARISAGTVPASRAGNVAAAGRLGDAAQHGLVQSRFAQLDDRRRRPAPAALAEPSVCGSAAHVGRDRLDAGLIEADGRRVAALARIRERGAAPCAPGRRVP